jgi:hypothetical protein
MAYSRNSAAVLLLVGVLAGVTVGGGVGVIAASTSKIVTVCANKKTNVLRYAKNGKCAKTETKVVLNQAGPAGVAGAKGDTGATGAKGDTGAAGTAGANGTNGTNGAAGASSPTGFTARSVCGADGTTLCAVGVQGPGGGTVFYVDTTNEMQGFDYLEAAPTDASPSAVFSTTTTMCGPDVTLNCTTSYVSDRGSSVNRFGLGTGREATTELVNRHSYGSVSKSSYAAGIADSYSTSSASDWWLPSRDELNELCKFARNTGQAVGASTECRGGSVRPGFADGYYSSSEASAGLAYTQDFSSFGNQNYGAKTQSAAVRAIRGF